MLCVRMREQKPAPFRAWRVDAPFRFKEETAKGEMERTALTGDWIVDGKLFTDHEFQRVFEVVPEPVPAEVLRLARALHRLMEQEPEAGEARDDDD
jgi:hypothetical protein